MEEEEEPVEDSSDTDEEDEEEQGSFILGFIAGLIGGCIVLALVLRRGKPKTRTGVYWGARFRCWSSRWSVPVGDESTPAASSYLYTCWYTTLILHPRMPSNRATVASSSVPMFGFITSTPHRLNPWSKS